MLIRIRVNGGGAVAALGARGKLDFAQVIGQGRGFPWPFQSPVTKGGDFQTLTLPAKQITRMQWDSLLIRPADAPGVTFEIESMQAISQRERRASIRSGVGWQGLADIYQEALVSRSPEVSGWSRCSGERLARPQSGNRGRRSSDFQDGSSGWRQGRRSAGENDRRATAGNRAPVDLSGQSGRKTCASGWTLKTSAISASGVLR
jgi:hypothetical protein